MTLGKSCKNIKKIGLDNRLLCSLNNQLQLILNCWNLVNVYKHYQQQYQLMGLDKKAIYILNFHHMLFDQYQSYCKPWRHHKLYYKSNRVYKHSLTSALWVETNWKEINNLHLLHTSLYLIDNFNTLSQLLHHFYVFTNEYTNCMQ